jgi:hypothetical protein
LKNGIHTGREGEGSRRTQYPVLVLRVVRNKQKTEKQKENTYVKRNNRTHKQGK